MNLVVLDTSALLRLYIPDGPLPDGVEQAFRLAERGNVRLLAPELLLAEAAQVLHKKWKSGRMSVAENEALLDLFVELPIEFLSDGPFLKHAAELARSKNITIYDSLFLAIADLNGATLLTADKTLLKTATNLGLQTTLNK